MGSSFYLGWLIPRETSLVIWGSEGEGSRFKLQRLRISFPSQITANMIVKKKKIFHWMAPVCETRQIKLENVLQWLVLHNLMTIFKYI
jgi:hypothetical protein